MYICTLRCPHFAEPCEMETAEYERIASYKEPCPIGEDDSFRYVDESNMFICLVVGSRSFTDYSLFCMKMDKILSSKTDQGNPDRLIKKVIYEIFYIKYYNI